MKIANIRTRNFRCLYDVDIPFENLTALVGRNGTGKSSVLKAIDVFFDLNYSGSIEDYCDKSTDNPIEIIITFKDFTPKEAELFGRYINNEQLTVTKRIDWIEGRANPRYYTIYKQIPEFKRIREIESKRDMQTAVRALIKSQQFEGLGGTFRSAEQALDILSQYEEEHPELTEPIESRFQFRGAINVGGGSLDNFTRFVFLPAVKEATEEFEGKASPISQFIDAIVTTKIKKRDDLIKFGERINQEIRDKYSPENLGELDELSGEISNLLCVYAPNSALRIGWGEPQSVQVGPPPILYSLVEDEFEGNISNKGHGLQRALILTLLEYLARIPPKVEEGENARVDLILALEEPEIYLHPSRCRYLANILLELSKNEGKENHQSRIQIIYSTHSPHFVGLDRFDSIRILRKVQNENTESMVTTESHYTLDEAAERYANICEEKRDKITRESFRVQTVPVMKPLTNEGFFGDMIVLVEGPSDIGVLWKIQEIMRKDWKKKDIALIPAGGKSQLLKAAVVFQGLGIPMYLIFDIDVDDPTTGRVLRFLGQPPEYPTEFIHETWACHEFNLEETLKKCLGEDNCNKLWVEVGKDFECNPKRIRKNEEAMGKFIEIAYGVGMKLDYFESIVEAISNYYNRAIG